MYPEALYSFITVLVSHVSLDLWTFFHVLLSIMVKPIGLFLTSFKFFLLKALKILSDIFVAWIIVLNLKCMFCY